MRVQRRHPAAVVPVRATANSAGIDFCTVQEERIFPGEQRKIRLGWACEIPEGHVGLLFIRSSVSGLGISLANGVGVIDSDFRGEVSALVKSSRSDPYTFQSGHRIAQLLLMPCDVVPVTEIAPYEELSSTDRGEGGWGSTGKQ
jgi:dUTP pyrophosphatase